jgi:hypothetical protein
MSERITRAEFARRAGVNKSTITRWIGSGRITLGPDGMLDEAEAHRQRAASESPAPHHQARKAQLDLAKAGDPTGSALPSALRAAERVSGVGATVGATDATGDLFGDAPSGSRAGLDGSDEVVRRTRYAQMLEREAVARMKEREDQEAAGQVIRRSAVERAMTDATAVILNAAETIPDRFAPQLLNIEEMARARALLREAMEEFMALTSAQLAKIAEPPA